MAAEKIDTAVKKLEEAIEALNDIKLPPGEYGRKIAVAKTNAETALLWAASVKNTLPF